MPLKLIQWSKQDMTKYEYENVTWPIKAWRCPLVVTEDMVWKEIIVQVTEKWVGGCLPKSFFLLENVEI